MRRIKVVLKSELCCLHFIKMSFDSNNVSVFVLFVLMTKFDQCDKKLIEFFGIEG